MKRHEGNVNAYTKSKKPIWKGYILRTSNYKTFCKRQIYGGNKNISSYWDLVERKGWIGGAEGISGAVKQLFRIL